MANSIHVGDIGTLVQVTCKDETGAVMNLSTATDLEYHIKKADNSILDVEPSLLTDGLDGKLVYALQQGDISVKGGYKLQVILTFPAGKWHSSIASFSVAPNLSD